MEKPPVDAWSVQECTDKAVRRVNAIKQLGLFLTLFGAFSLVACGGYNSMSSSSSQTPVVTGSWTTTFAPIAQGAAAPASTMLTVNFSQNGNSLTGTVTAVNNPASSCFPAITPNGTTFTVTGQVSSSSQSNVNVSVGFTSGSSTGTINGTGNLAYLGTTVNGTFSFATGTAGCTSGTFTMTKVG